VLRAPTRPARLRDLEMRNTSFSIRSPSRNLRTICAGVCRFRFIVMSSLAAC
jgi:hypothetical protein